jgi:hypothetical protein
MATDVSRNTLPSKRNKAPDANRRESLFVSGAFWRVLIVLAMLGSAVVVGLRPSWLYLAVPVLVIGTIVLIQRPQLGLYALIVCALAVPFGAGTGSDTSINAGMLVLGGLLLMWLIEGFVRRTLSIQDHPTTLPLIVFLVIAVIAFFTGQLDWFPRVDPAPIRAQLGALSLFFLSAAAFWLGAFRLRQVNWLRNMMWVFFGVGALWVFGLLLPPTQSLVTWMFERGSSGATGSVFWVWMVGLAFGQALLNTQLRQSLRVVLLVLVAGSLYTLLVPFRAWSSGWVPTTVTLAVIIWLGFPRYRPVLLAAGIAVALVQGLTLITGVINEGDNSYSYLTRVAAAQTLWQLIQHNPVLGFGPANYYFYTPLFSILGYYNLRFNSHNNYVDLVAQTGFLGLIAFFWFAISVGKYILSVRLRVPNGFARAYVISAFAAWVGTLVSGALGDWFLPFVYNIGFFGFRSSMLAWLFLGGVITLDRLSAKQSSQHHGTP